MKLLFTTLFIVATISSMNAQYINELHYDNVGGDVGEFVEVFYPDPQPANLGDYVVHLYNGSASQLKVYGTPTALNSMTATCASGGCFYVWNLPANGIQNGNPDGLSLSGPAGLIEFLSYEGTFTPTDGPAAGVLSTEMGAAESNTTTPAGESLQRNASGNWEGPLPQTAGAINSNALPISLTHFGLRSQDDGSVLLNWATESEFGNDYFVIEHSLDGQRFEAIAEIAGAGDSYQAVNYNFTHETPARGMNYYRLKQVDYSRAFSFSEVQSLRLAQENELQVWPTLIENSTRIQLGDDKIDGNLLVSNVQGQVILSKTLENQEGAYEFDLSQVPNGTYVLILRTAGVQMNRRILIQR